MRMDIEAHTRPRAVVTQTVPTHLFVCAEMCLCFRACCYLSATHSFTWCRKPNGLDHGYSLATSVWATDHKHCSCLNVRWNDAINTLLNPKLSAFKNAFLNFCKTIPNFGVICWLAHFVRIHRLCVVPRGLDAHEVLQYGWQKDHTDALLRTRMTIGKSCRVVRHFGQTWNRCREK